MIGLSDAVPSCAINLRLRCNIEGRGVDPLNPPLVWEAFDGEGWTECELDVDETGGLNRDGDVIVHVPRTHTALAHRATSAPAGCAAGSSRPRRTSRTTAPRRRSPG